MSGLLGIGGGTVVGPILALSGLALRRATGTALALVAPVAIAGVAAEGLVAPHNLDVGIAATLAFGGILGVMVGRGAANRLPERSLRLLFALLLVATALRQFGLFGALPHDRLPGWFGASDILRWPLTLVLGMAAGVCAILFGVGGGILMVPGLVFAVGGFGMREASGISLMAMVPLAGYGSFAAWRDGRVDGRALRPLLTLALLGAVAGVWLRNRALSPQALSIAFGAFLLLVTANLLRRPMPATPPAAAATDPHSARKS